MALVLPYHPLFVVVQAHWLVKDIPTGLRRKICDLGGRVELSHQLNGELYVWPGDERRLFIWGEELCPTWACPWRGRGDENVSPAQANAVVFRAIHG